jgi:tetratricopeptide (TPR) repeat protein
MCSASCSAISTTWPPRESRWKKPRAVRPASQTGAREALADLYLQEADYSRAINQLEALAALEPARPERAVAVGLAQARAGREDAAGDHAGPRPRAFPDAPQVYAALGHVWLTEATRRGDRVALNKAIEALQKAGSHSDATSDTLAELGRAWLLAGDRLAAERALRQAVAKLPGTAGHLSAARRSHVP